MTVGQELLLLDFMACYYQSVADLRAVSYTHLAAARLNAAMEFPGIPFSLSCRPRWTYRHCRKYAWSCLLYTSRCV